VRQSDRRRARHNTTATGGEIINKIKNGGKSYEESERSSQQKKNAYEVLNGAAEASGKERRCAGPVHVGRGRRRDYIAPIPNNNYYIVKK
jgi:hypothetical protein